MIENFEGAIFDLDGTLIDSGNFPKVLWKRIGMKFLNDESFYPSPDDDKAVRTMTLSETMEFIHTRYGIGDSVEELFDFSKEFMKEFYSTEIKPKAGVIEFLDYCVEKNIKMCIASATRKPEIILAVKKCGMEKYFSTILSCADIGRGKSSPDIFIKALEMLGTPPENTWVFEDSLTAIKTANSIGLNTVGIYDDANFGHDEMKKVSTAYIDAGETMKKLID